MVSGRGLRCEVRGFRCRVCCNRAGNILENFFTKKFLKNIFHGPDFFRIFSGKILKNSGNFFSKCSGKYFRKKFLGNPEIKFSGKKTSAEPAKELSLKPFINSSPYRTAEGSGRPR